MTRVMQHCSSVNQACFKTVHKNVALDSKTGHPCLTQIKGRKYNTYLKTLLHLTIRQLSSVPLRFVGVGGGLTGHDKRGQEVSDS